MRLPFKRTGESLFYGGLQCFVNDASVGLKSKLHREPLWVNQPLSLQLDTNNKRCSLSCVYCNPQNSFIEEEGVLPFETIKSVVGYLKDKRVRLTYVYPFMNSDPLLEPRLPFLAYYLRRNLCCNVLVSTNGVCYGNRGLLASPYLTDVWFTISASSDANYLAVHGKPLFDCAKQTLFWLKDNRFSTQRLGVRYILFKGNASGLVGWFKLFKGFETEVRPLHFGVNRVVSKALGVADDLVSYYRRKKVEYYIKHKYPCNCLHNLAVGFNGEVMQCCDLPYKYSFGHVEEVDLLEVYYKRLERGLDVEGCRGCNQKNPFWRELFEDYVW